MSDRLAVCHHRSCLHFSWCFTYI